MKRDKVGILLVLMLFIGVCGLLYPAVSQYWNSKTQTRAVENYQEILASLKPEDYTAFFAEAEAYNTALAALDAAAEGEAFDRFWARYPVQIGQTAAREAWESVCDKHDVDFVLSRLETWRNSKQWAMEDGRFIPKPEKWLAEEWFLRSPAASPPMGATGELGAAELEAIQKLLKEG